MRAKSIHITADFAEIATRSIDERQRVCVGDIMKNFKRVQVYLGEGGEVLLRPLVEIPASEAWLYKNKKALVSVRKGLEEAAAGKISKLNLKSL